jgi:cytochrome b
MTLIEQKQTVLVWDLPVRVFHGLLVVSFAGAWLTAENETQPMLHYAFGYSACALVLFRIIWGFIGTRYARFGQFVKGPSKTIDHMKSLFTRNPDSELGHNPAGALVMMLLMALILLLGLTGYWSVKDLLSDLFGEAHEVMASAAMVLVVVHLAAAIFMSFLHHENLLKSMVSGEKQGTIDQAIKSPLSPVGLLLAVAWALVFSLLVSGALPALTQ